MRAFTLLIHDITALLTHDTEAWGSIYALKGGPSTPLKGALRLNPDFTDTIRDQARLWKPYTCVYRVYRAVSR